MMGEAKRKRIAEVADGIAKELTDKGLLIEAGWAAFRALCIPADAPPIQLHEMRCAFFTGAQHLFGSIMGALDPGEEPSEADMRRISLIDKELHQFIKEFELRHVPTEGRA